MTPKEILAENITNLSVITTIFCAVTGCSSDEVIEATNENVLALLSDYYASRGEEFYLDVTIIGEDALEYALSTLMGVAERFHEIVKSI